MKKLILLIVAMALLLVGCTTNQPTETAEQSLNNALKGIQDGDESLVNKYLKYNDLLNLGEFAISTDDSKLFREVISNITYSVKSIEENNQSAEAEVEILNADMEAVLEIYLDEYYSYLMEEMDKDASQQSTKEDMLERMNNRLFEIVEEEKENQVTNTIKITMEKSDSRWSIPVTEEFKNAITGNLANLFKQIEKSTKEE